MKWNREDLKYLKTHLAQNIVGLIGMIVAFFIGLMKNIDELIIIGVVVGSFNIYQIVKTRRIIDEIENGKK